MIADNYVPLAGNGSDHRSLTAHASNVLLLIPVAVLVLAADSGFIHFDDAHKLLEIIVPHTGAEPMADIPSCMQGRALAEKHAPNLTGRNALFALQYGVENLEPRFERNVGILENRSYQNREAVRSIVQVGLIPTEPIERSRLRSIDLCVAAFGALNLAVRPTPIREILTASGFVPEHCHKFLEGHHA